MQITRRRFGWIHRPATRVLAAAAVAVAVIPAAAPPAPADTASGPPAHPSRLVDPFIGSSNGGNTWPGATRPFGMIAWSPTSTAGDQTGTAGTNGYSYDTTRVRGFSLTHVNGAGCNPGAAGDVPILPYAGSVDSSPSSDVHDEKYASDFSHDDERATPGRYSVTLDSGVRTDLATTERAGAADLTWPKGATRSLLMRTSNSLNGSEDATTVINPRKREISGSVLTGAFCGRRANGGENNQRTYYRLHFTATFDRDFSATGTWQNGDLRPGTRRATGGEGYKTGAARQGRGSGGYVTFASGRGPVHMRVGISYVSLAGARANLTQEIPRRSTVDSVAREATKAWDSALDAVDVSGGSAARRTIFYTALYHSFLQPNLINDADGRYYGADGTVHRLRRGQGAQYGNFSGWDQYRAHIQLLALLKPRVAGDYAQSLYNVARQNGGVWDRWVHLSGPTHVMTGDPSAATVATFAAYGVKNFDHDGAFRSLLRQATVPHVDGLSDAGCPGQCEGQRPNLERYLELKYAPNDTCHCWGGAAETLEDSVADAALAAWAGERRDRRAHRALADRGTYWRNVFNPSATPAGGYVQARNDDGTWVTPFDPGSEVGFAQGTSATYTWMVPQDVQGLAAAMGGRATAARRLDAFFHKPDGSWSLRAGDPLRYDATNEPGIHAPWLYNSLGQPWKTQETVRQILDDVYTTGPSGLPGNDDLGTMSAWYVFSALGIYPQAPGGAELLVGAPVFPRAVLHRAGRGAITINAPGASDANRYVDGMRLDGRSRAKLWTPASLVTSGGRLDIALAPRPDTTLGIRPADLPVDVVDR